MTDFLDVQIFWTTLPGETFDIHLLQLRRAVRMINYNALLRQNLDWRSVETNRYLININVPKMFKFSKILSVIRNQ